MKTMYSKVIIILTCLIFYVNLSGQNNNELSLDSTKQNKVIDENQLFITYEIPASFPYGNDSLQTFIYSNLKWPSPAFCGEYTAIIQFTIEADGTPCDHHILRPRIERFDEEALRVIELIEMWTPGYIYDNAVRCNMIMPVRFKLLD